MVIIFGVFQELYRQSETPPICFGGVIFTA